MSQPISIPSDLERVARNLVARAQQASAVARVELGDGLQMFAYPSAACSVLGIGCLRLALRPDTIAQVLHQRFEQPGRFAPWLPAVFNDGSFYLLQRLPHASGEQPRTPSGAGCAEVLALLTV